ncbi:cadmium resistance transporter [Companilactobacillus sp. DQM5]|uniref:cadmium resistance transporter n=1 Tax=Companilactobacillus sp. DQM5 TaxID=3463359 RepID=UPI00405828A5
MNYWILMITFLSVNLDFFFMLIFLLKQYKFNDVLLGYLLGNLFMVTIGYLIGKTLSVFLPEWILGVLGFLPIYLALRKENDDENIIDKKSPFISVFITYLSVCLGCNLAVFSPILLKENITNFFLTLIIIIFLSILVVVVIKKISLNKIVSIIMEKYGETLMKVCYIFIGLYVFFDSGLIMHLMVIFN